MTTERSGMSLEQLLEAIDLKLERGRDAGKASLMEWADCLRSHLSRDAVVSDFPLGAIENGRVFADRVENTDLSCVAGDLHLCVDWHEFRRCFEHLANWALTESFAARHAAVPDAMVVKLDEGTVMGEYSSNGDIVTGWNACRKAMLAQRDGG